MLNEALQAVASDFTRNLRKQLTCAARHPKYDERCVLPALNGHTKHKTEFSQRWTA